MSILDTKEEREALRWALKACGGDPADVDFFACDDEHREVLRAVTNPAKLAEFMASEGRRLGLNIYDDDPGDDFALPYADIFDRNGGVCVLISLTWEQLRDGADEYQLGPHQTRRILAQWLELPSPCRETTRSPDEHPPIDRCTQCQSALRSGEFCLECLERSRNAAERVLRGEA